MSPSNLTAKVRITSFFRSSYVGSMGVRISNAALSLGVSILLARLLGPQEYGRYGILLSVAMLLAIPFTAGLPKTLTKEIAVARVEKDHGLVRVLIRLGTKTFIGIVPIVLLITFCLFASGYEVAGLSTGIIIAAVLAPISSADANRLAIMRGLGSAVKSQVPDMLLRPLITMVIVLGLTVTVGQATAITGIIAYSIATVFGFAVGSLMVQKELKAVPDMPSQTPIRKKSFLTSVLTLSLLGGAASLTGNIDMLLLNELSTYEAAGQYKVALAGLALVVMGGNAVSAVAFTRLAETIPTGDKKAIARLSDQALKWSIVFTTGATAFVFLIGQPIIEMVYGSNYSDVWGILVILSVGFCIAFSFGQAPEIAALSGAQIPAAFSIIVSIGVTVWIATLTADQMGVKGIALASMIGTILRFSIISFIVRMKLGVNITLFGLIARHMRKGDGHDSKTG